jgi:hypothetical protein
VFYYKCLDQTVNPLASAFVGSSPTSPTIHFGTIRRERRPEENDRHFQHLGGELERLSVSESSILAEILRAFSHAVSAAQN